MRVLVAAAHPDDETLGCGGTLAQHAAAGDAVAVVTFTDGVGARDEFMPSARADRRAAFLDAMAELGLTDASRLTTLSYPDNRMDAEPVLGVARQVERVLAAVRPDVVYTHHAGDLNVDHRCVCEAVLAATRPGTEHGAGVREVLAFEVPSSTEWAFGLGAPFCPDVFVELDRRALEAKLRALARYRREVRLPPHPRSVEHVEALARVRGGAAGVLYAEAFRAVRIVRPAGMPGKIGV